MDEGGSLTLTERQKEIVEGIKKGIKERKTISELAADLRISEAYVSKLKKIAGLAKKGSDVREWIEKHEEVKDWLREIKGGDAHENTKRQFGGALKKYCEFRGLSPLELLDEAEEDLKHERRERKVKTHLLDFRDYLKEEGRSKNTIGVYISALRSFFSSHEVLLPKLSNGRREVEWEKEEFDREKVKDLVNVCSPRERAIFLTMFQSGLAANEVSNLRVRDLKEERDGITILRLTREKNRFKFVTFLGRDAREAIEQYLKIRNEGNLIPARPNLSEKAKVKGEGDFLFVTYDFHSQQWNKVDNRHISKYMLQACKRLGWYNGEKRNPWRPHALRASFATILNNNGVPKNFVDFMLGHKQGGTDEAYFKSHIETILKHYKDSELLLSISDVEKIPDSKYEELKIENKFLVQKYEEQERKIEELEFGITSLLQDRRELEQDQEKYFKRKEIADEVYDEFKDKYGKELIAKQLQERKIELHKRYREAGILDL
jgi:integrase